jgi:glycosyltransferase involved in cell wall biosynthesis
MPVQPVSRRWKLSHCDHNTVLFVGRFDRHKGGDVVIDAFSEVLRSRPESRLVFAGPDRGFHDSDGRRWQLSEYVRSRIPNKVLRDRVAITGQIRTEEIEDWRRRALVTVSASRWENLSLAVLEAMSAGCPVVVADQGGLTEYLQDGVNSRLFTAGDPFSLAATLLSLLQDPRSAEALGERALEHIEEHFNPSRVAATRIQAYERAIDRKAARRMCGGY